ncbi:hypothetical protein I2492_19595 [Budviciaceae bacterium CWB-B4]|uniref:Uncharacterized protein n=1 Tax=Limnobaculum xujianqingii TaxID=2738837 RepID=A0A9D7AMF8_9GAMM|nr:hypothetical protein [Limnobaculum xujianqingii]MBK5075194.1 hypothetical protein [Limnobaculum xujianqingii]MBK5178512.1 hypothetical protein [Limnobaculum xujianqingii]
MKTMIVKSNFSSDSAIPCIINFSIPDAVIQVAAIFTKQEIEEREVKVKFAANSKSTNFSYDLNRMKSRIESDDIPIPQGLNTAEALDKWLMGLNLE